MPAMRLSLFLLCILLTRAGAETPASESPRAEPRIAFRGCPRPCSDGFFLLESGFSVRGGGHARRGKADFLFTAAAGVMKNLGPGGAVGGTINLLADDDGSRIGFAPRYRFWLDDRMGIDAFLGILVSGDDNYLEPKFPGVFGGVSFTALDLLSLDLSAEAYRYERETYAPYPTLQTEKGTATGIYVGASGRSYLAPVVPLVLAVLVAATFDGGGWN